MASEDSDRPSQLLENEPTNLPSEGSDTATQLFENEPTKSPSGGSDTATQLFENESMEQSIVSPENEIIPEIDQPQTADEIVIEPGSPPAELEVEETEDFQIDTFTLRSSQETVNIPDEAANDETASNITTITEEEAAEKDDVTEQKVEPSVKEGIRTAGDDDLVTLQYDTFEELLESDTQSDPEESFVLLDDESGGKDEESIAPSTKVKEKRKRKSIKSIRSRQASADQISLTSSVKTFTSAKGGSVRGDTSPVDSRRASLSSRLTQVEEEQDEEEGEEEEDEEEATIDEEEEEGYMTAYARYQYYQMYDQLYKQYQEEMTKNSYYIKKLALYYQKRKMFHVLYEGKQPADVLKKYEKQLDDYEYITELKADEQKDIEEQVKDLREKCVTKEQEAQNCFEKLQQYESEVGKEIINSESGRHYGEKLIDRYLKRQKIQLNNLKKIRLDYIKIRNRVADTQEALDAIDNLGPDLHLIDYEQLKLDNRNLLDKLEEKEVELTKVRTRCQNVVQILAHRREKSDALQADLGFLNETLTTVTGEYDDVREQLNGLKMERDFYRSEIERMKKEAGLLSQPKLLEDMSNTIDEGQHLSRKLEQIRKDYGALATKVKNLRRNKRSRARMRAITEKMIKGNDVKDTGALDSESILGDFDI